MLGQAVALAGRTIFCANREQDYSWTRRGGIDVWCSNTVKVDVQMSIGSTFDTKMLTILSSPSLETRMSRELRN